MSQSIVIGISDYKLAKGPEILVTYALGSCVGVCLYDKVSKVGGLSHIMLPDSTQIRNNSNIAKFADTGIEELVRIMVAAGAGRSRTEWQGSHGRD